MNLKPPLLCAAIVSAATALVSCVPPFAMPAPPKMTIATADPGTVYHPVGNAICRIVNLAVGEDTPMRCRAIPSHGALANVEQVRRGQATFGLAQADLAYGAYRGEDQFVETGPDPELRTVIALHRQSFTIIARAASGIFDFEDLRGKRIGVGKRGAGYTFTRDVMIDLYGWTISDLDRSLELGPTEQDETLCNEAVDAIIFDAAHPDGLTQAAANRCAIRLVRVTGPAVTRLLAAYPYYVASTIPGGMYRGNAADTPTLGTRALLVTSARQPNAIVYALVKAVLEDYAEFRHLHPALRALEREDIVPNETVMPIHPGAVIYFREIGLLRQE